MMVRERRTREGRGVLRERETKRGEWECGETVREMELEVGREREDSGNIERWWEIEEWGRGGVQQYMHKVFLESIKS